MQRLAVIQPRTSRSKLADTLPQGHKYLSKDLLADGPGAHGDGPQGPDHWGDGPRLDELRVVRVVRADLPEREPVADAEHDVTCQN